MSDRPADITEKSSEAPFLSFNAKNSQELLAESPSAGSQATFDGACKVGAFSYVGARSSISRTNIGRYCSIARNVTIGPTSHPTDRFTTHPIAFRNKGPFANSAQFKAILGGEGFPDNRLRTTIGNDVWIGEGVLIKRGVKVGDGAIVAAGAVVVKDVEPYAIVGGVAAKKLRFRFPARIIDRLLASEWWRFDLSTLALNDDAYMDVEQFLGQFELALSRGTAKALPLKFWSIGQVHPAREDDV